MIEGTGIFMPALVCARLPGLLNIGDMAARIGPLKETHCAVSQSAVQFGLDYLILMGIGIYMRCKQLILKRITLIDAGAPMSGLLALATLIALFTVAISASAATVQNSQSSLGIELAGISRWSPEMPFLNIMKSNGGWLTQNCSTFDT